MTICGAVITLRDDPELAQRLLAVLSAHGAIELGERSGNRVPIVIEAGTRDEFDAIWRWLGELDGVLARDLVQAYFDPCDDKERTDPCNSTADAS